MNFVQTMIDRLIGVPLPKELYLRIKETPYRIVGVDSKGVYYTHINETGRSLLAPHVYSDLNIKGFSVETERKLVNTPKYFIDCQFDY